MSWILFIVVGIWLFTTALSYSIHRLSRVQLPVFASALLAVTSLGMLWCIFTSWISQRWLIITPSFVGVFVGSVFVLTGLHVWLYRVRKVKFRFPVLPWSLLQALILLATQFLLIAGIFFVAVHWNERCYQQRQDVMVFTGHLKSLCVEQKGSGLCPHNEDALRAFDPPRYQRIQKCARTTYSYVSDEKFEWNVYFQNQHMQVTPTKLPGIGDPPEEFEVF